MLNAIYAAAKSKADAAQATANTATGQVTQLPVINGGFDIAPTGYGWTPDSGTGWITDTGSNSPGVQPNCARHTGTSSPTTGAYRNNGLAPCQPGQTYKTQALIKAVGANGICYVYISWVNAAGAEIGTTIGNTVTGTTTAGSYAVGQAPAGTVFARTCLAYSGQTTGDYFVDNVVCTQYPSSIDEVPDGSINARTLATRISAGNPLIDFSAGYHVNKNVDNVADGSTYGRPLNSRLNANRPFIDFADSFQLNKNVDNLADGNTYVRSMASSSSPEIVDNPDFEASAVVPVPGWKSGSGCTVAYTSSAYNGTQSLSLVGTSTFGYVTSDRKYPCVPGEKYLVTAAIANNAVAGNSGNVYMQIFDKTGATLVFAGVGNALAPGTGYQLLTQLCTIPANATSYALTITVQGVANGNSFFDNIRIARVRNLDSEVYDGATYGRPVQSRLSSGVPFIDFGAGIHLNKNLDNLADTATYGRVSISDLNSNRIGLRVAGSGQRIGDQRNLAQRTVTNIPAKVPTTISYSASAGSPATATISVGAFTVLSGSVSTAYNASSAGVTGANGSTVTYYLYMNDPAFAGGVQTLIATTNGNDVYGGDGYVYVGPVSVTYPTSGGGSGGGGGGGAGACVCADMWLDHDTQAGEAEMGYLADCLDLPTSGMRKFRRRLHGMEMSLQPCVRLTTDGGAILECSTTTPFDLPSGGMTYAPEMEGLQVVTDKSIETVASVIDIGEQMVCHQHYGGCSYAAGIDPDHRIYSHNSIGKP